MPAPVLLQPRPLARVPGQLLLLPLLPLQEPSKYLPAELWNDILAHALVHEVAGATSWCWSLLAVSKAFRVSLERLLSDSESRLTATFNRSAFRKSRSRLCTRRCRLHKRPHWRSSTNFSTQQTKNGIPYEGYLIPPQVGGSKCWICLSSLSWASNKPFNWTPL